MATVASANVFDQVGRELSLVFGQCSGGTRAQVEAILNNADLSQPTIVQAGNNPLRLFTKKRAKKNGRKTAPVIGKEAKPARSE